jgi:hypothetical protein
MAPSASAAPQSPSPSPSVSPSPALVAADGTDVAACRDGRCQIIVRGAVTIPLAPKFGFTRLIVTFTPPDRTSFSGGNANNSVSGSIGGLGMLRANGIQIVVETVSPTGAVLRLTPLG